MKNEKKDKNENKPLPKSKLQLELEKDNQKNEKELVDKSAQIQELKQQLEEDMRTSDGSRIAHLGELDAIKLTAEGCVEVVASEEDARRAARELVDAAAALAAYDGDRDDASAAVVMFD